MKAKAPSEQAVADELGAARSVWDAIVGGVVAKHGAVEREWKASKSDFGWMCLLKQKKRTLLYLTPEKGTVRVGIVLGERAVALALASGLPEGVKTLLREARPYAEGRGIRFPATSAADVATVLALVLFKTTPA